jgi:hypothetical protein
VIGSTYSFNLHQFSNLHLNTKYNNKISASGISTIIGKGKIFGHTGNRSERDGDVT